MNLRCVAYCILLLSHSVFISCIHAAQVPFQFYEEDTAWNLDEGPAENATGHLIFATASSFMQHWPNTRYRNGHSIVVGTIPPNTLLYHGRPNNQLPTLPEWLATDPEHSYLFCRGSSETGCWHLTMVSVRPLKVLYFDGSSAAKMLGGPMESQDIVSWGRVMPERFFEERQRLDDLCAWGKNFGVDGFVRMEMDFEIMYCDFTDGLEIVSFSNLAAQRPGRGRTPLAPPQDVSFLGSMEVIYSGSWHNHYPGDNRIKLDYTRFVSFYDTSLVPSLTESRVGQTRLQHHLESISKEDADAVIARLESMLSEDHSLKSNGVDWKTLLHVIQDRFAERLDLLRFILNSTDIDYQTRASKAYSQLEVMVQPYRLHTAVPGSTPSKSWAVPVYKLCATSHTKWIHSSSLSMTPSEEVLLHAIDETNREICRVIVNLWMEGIQQGLDDTVDIQQIKKADHEGSFLDEWRQEIDQLMEWLDWSVWLKCRPSCSAEEICYLPTWPFFKGGLPHLPGRRPPLPGGDELESDKMAPALEPREHEDPQPKCVRRIEPYEIL